MFTRSLKRGLAATVRLLRWSRIWVLKEWDRQRENVMMWWLLTPDGLPATVAWLFPQQITVWYEASCLQKTCDSYLVKMVTLCPSLFQCVNSVHVCVCHYLAVNPNNAYPACLVCCGELRPWSPPTPPDCMVFVVLSDIRAAGCLRTHWGTTFSTEAPEKQRQTTNVG